MRISEQEIHCMVQVYSNKQPWMLSAIYANYLSTVRNKLWESLINIHNTIGMPWLLGGDFNEILDSKEKFGGLPISNNRVDKFMNCLNYCKLIDLGFHGSRFTWTNKRRHGNTILERLDRFLANYEWLNLYPDAVVKHLPRTFSDHCPY